MKLTRTLAAIGAAALIAASCGSDDDDGDSGDSDAAVEESGESGGDASDVSTVSALDLGVPAAVPADFPVPGDAVLVETVEAGQSGERLDVIIGTNASSDDAIAIVQPYIEGLDDSSFSGNTGQGFVDFGGTPSAVVVFVSSSEALDPPTQITISVANAG